ncbi:hypothetical protein [Rhizobium sophorae]|uniref:hypothetical protein n=1 Tax=Rhizobium sophorae TaxID=1535242 RepID=UPI001FEBF3E3|nr:hypothetical protein [Rhizobium sophorae]
MEKPIHDCFGNAKFNTGFPTRKCLCSFDENLVCVLGVEVNATVRQLGLADQPCIPQEMNDPFLVQAVFEAPQSSYWQRQDAEARIREVLDAAKARGTQRVLDADGRFLVTFEPVKKTLEELFAQPGPLSDDDVTLRRRASAPFHTTLTILWRPATWLVRFRWSVPMVSESDMPPLRHGRAWSAAVVLPRQCAMNIGMLLCSIMLRVTPPKSVCCQRG